MSAANIDTLTTYIAKYLQQPVKESLKEKYENELKAILKSNWGLIANLINFDLVAELKNYIGHKFVEKFGPNFHQTS